MKLAVLTDIHGNRQAFEAVLADVAGQGVQQIALLGDIVGYGGDPCWCCDKAAELVGAGAICVRGNHDNAASGGHEDMSPLAREAIDWTKRQVSDSHRNFLSHLPLTVDQGDTLYVHASANEPGAWNYVTSAGRAKPSFRATKARLILCGHVHVPLLISCSFRGVVEPQVFQSGLPIPLLANRRWLAVLGSVGQPRDGVAQAAWAVLDTETRELTFRRTPYDLAGAASRIREAGLPELLATRLLLGK